MEGLIVLLILAVVGVVIGIVHYFNQFDSRGFRDNKIHRNGTKYDKDGYDYDGYDSQGFNLRKFHKSGTKYNEKGYDYQGYDSRGFNSSKTHKNGTKYDDSGYDHAGFNKDGLHKNGTKYNELGYDIEGYNSRGFNNNFIHKNGTKFNSVGYDYHGFDKYGYNKDGIDDKGIPWWHDPKDSIITNKYYIKFLKSFTDKNIKNKTQASIFVNNSFNTLGLESNSLNNNIVRRATEIEKFSKANINKKYELDFFGELIDRTDKNIKRSRDKLNSIKDRMIETFLWFDYDIKEIKDIITTQNIEEALLNMKRLYDGKKDSIILKNLLLLQIYYSLIVNNYKMLELSLKEWKKVIDSKDYWTYFNKKIKDSQDYQIDDSALIEFKDNIKSTIMNFYFSLTKGTSLISINDLFFDEFGMLSDSYISESLIKMFDKGRSIVKKLDGLDSKKKYENFLVKDRNEINKLIDDYKDFLNEIRQKSLSKYPEIRKINDEFVKTIRSISIGVHNNAKGDQNLEFSKDILISVNSIHVSEATSKLINKDIEEIELGEKKEKLISTITEQLKKNQFSSAESNIDKLENLDKSISNMQIVIMLKKILFKNRANHGFKTAMDEANRIAKSYTARYNINKIIVQLQTALQHLELLHLIATDEKDYEEVRTIESLQRNLQSQIYQIKMSRY